MTTTCTVKFLCKTSLLATVLQYLQIAKRIKMSNNLTDVRITVRCAPGNLWTTQDGNDTYWHGTHMSLLREFEKFLGVNYKFVQIPLQYDLINGKYFLSFILSDAQCPH